MKKIVFIHGMGGGKRDAFMMGKLLKNFKIIPFEYNSWLTDPIEKTAGDLEKFINNLKLKKNEKINIIGVSAGGIIAEYYFKAIDSTKVEKLITICSPINGLNIFSFIPKKFKGVWDMKKDRNIIKKINKIKLSKNKEKNYWCFFDPLVPGKIAKGHNPEKINFFLHWIVHFWPPLIFKIKKFLE